MGHDGDAVCDCRFWEVAAETSVTAPVRSSSYG